MACSALSARMTATRPDSTIPCRVLILSSMPPPCCPIRNWAERRTLPHGSQDYGAPLPGGTVEGENEIERLTPCVTVYLRGLVFPQGAGEIFHHPAVSFAIDCHWIGGTVRDLPRRGRRIGTGVAQCPGGDIVPLQD